MDEPDAKPRGHRGLHPQDEAQFLRPEAVATLRTAAGDLAWLLARGYAPDASLKLVGDRYALRKRQRNALQRSALAPERAAARRARQVAPDALRGRSVLMDGFNQVITVEVAFSGGVLLRGPDGALRDLASVHGTYRLVSETPRAVEALAAWLQGAGVAAVRVLLDAPVSNSGRIAGLIRRIAARDSLPWTVELVQSPDAMLKAASDVVATSDGAVLDAGPAWLDLAGAVVAADAPGARVLDLRGKA